MATDPMASASRRCSARPPLQWRPPASWFSSAVLPRRHRRGGGPPEKTPSACPTAQTERLIRVAHPQGGRAGLVPRWPPTVALGELQERRVSMPDALDEGHDLGHHAGYFPLPHTRTTPGAAAGCSTSSNRGARRRTQCRSQPTGTGFSYISDDRDTCHDETGVSNDLQDFLQEKGVQPLHLLTK
ncbi:hypothetical protein PVAP13_5KG764100 [Panicum virgatum]|uniref:Uncharacterized protein n=1 Tax=Panicum virgatum TaxID=38727 RepID=A0A8T0T251_PANVG|nr:hypothetical protein PVAP13_5KG764100 [Panicum virgatum]